MDETDDLAMDEPVPEVVDGADPLIAEMVEMQRDRRIVVVAAVIGIVASAALGMAFVLGGLGRAAQGAGGARNPGSLIFFVAPFAVAIAIGYAVHALVRGARVRAATNRSRRTGELPVAM